MRILICAATSLEIQPILNKLPGLHLPGKSVESLITGIGAMAAAYELTKKIYHQRPDLVILAGIGGSFDPLEPAGEVYFIRKDIMADLGVRENNEWKDLFDLGFQDASIPPYSSKFLYNEYPFPELELLNKGTGCTVNQITTDPVHILSIVRKYHPDVESMEGAAVHFVCLKESIPFIHLRAISNTVGQRDKSRWNIKLAVENLNRTTEQLLTSSL